MMPQWRDDMNRSSILFTPFQVEELSLKNRIVMVPLYLGYANPDGTVSPLMLDHYREMAASGAAMIVTEHSAVHVSGLASPFMVRVDHDRYTPGIAKLAEIVHEEGALAFCQINHAGRYAFMPERFAPSPVKMGDVVPKEMTLEEIDRIVEAYAASARRVKEAGFDGVEIHGGTGYLIVQFLSPRTNRRTDAYGGELENRMRFPLQVVEAVRAAVGENYRVGYRFLADELLPDGLHPEETVIYAMELDKRGIAYFSVMAGTYDSFSSPQYVQREKCEAYMAEFAGIIKKAVPQAPVIAAGRIQMPETADRILREGVADLIGLARVLFADPTWPKKAMGTIKDPIVKCEPSCSLCMKRLLRGQPAMCSQWGKNRRESFLARVGETQSDLE
jgi:2,4-dienoyl-CoA reductase-like NADH-dependent reductase (Old Yellow Enzyme family)